MKNLLLPVLILTLTIGFGCKNIQNLLQEKKPVIGKWKQIKFYNPEENKWIESPFNYTIEFLPNGDYDTSLSFSAYGKKIYSTDNSVNPPRITITNLKDKEQQKLIYQFQGNNLIIKSGAESNTDFAKDFKPDPKYQLFEYQKQ